MYFHQSSDVPDDSSKPQAEETESFTFFWRIEKPFEILNTAEKTLVSPEFTTKSNFTTVWQLVLDLDALYLCLIHHSEWVYVDYKISVRRGDKNFSVEFEDIDLSGRNLVCYMDQIFRKCDVEMMGVLPSKSLYVKCNLKIHPVKDSEHVSENSLCTDLYQLFDTQILTDFELRIENRSFAVHKIVLWARARKLALHFGISPEVKPSPTFCDVTDMNADVVQILIRFLYSGKVVTKSNDVLSKLSQIGKTFDIRELVRICCPFVKKYVAHTSLRTESVRFTWQVPSKSLQLHRKIESPLVRTTSSEFKFVLSFQEQDGVASVSLKKMSSGENSFAAYVKVEVVGESRGVVTQHRLEIIDGCNLLLPPEFTEIIQTKCTSNVTENENLNLKLFCIFSRGRAESEIHHAEYSTECKPYLMQDVYSLCCDWRVAFEDHAQDFSDVTLQVGGSKIPAHRAILSARSPVFANMFRHNMFETKNGIVVVEDVEETVFNPLLEYMYSASWIYYSDMTYEDIVALFQCADRYQVVEVRDQYADALIDHFVKHKPLELFVLADAHGHKKLKEAARNFICLNSHILRTAEWRELAQRRPDLESEVAQCSPHCVRRT